MATPHPKVSYVAGSAERIPLAVDSCDVVVLFLSFHHVQDQSAAAAEIAKPVEGTCDLLILG